jgi:hypothetical protein
MTLAFKRDDTAVRQHSPGHVDAACGPRRALAPSRSSTETVSDAKSLGSGR